jgi:hypothetical protein
MLYSVMLPQYNLFREPLIASKKSLPKKESMDSSKETYQTFTDQ